MVDKERAGWGVLMRYKEVGGEDISLFDLRKSERGIKRRWLITGEKRKRYFGETSKLEDNRHSIKNKQI